MAAYTEYKLQTIGFSEGWKITRDVFYDIDPADDINESDKYDNIYGQEDLLQALKEDYMLDLGWYGSDDFTKVKTGYCIHLFRGHNWNEAEILVHFRSRSKQVIVNKLNEIIQAVDSGEFNNSQALE